MNGKHYIFAVLLALLASVKVNAADMGTDDPGLILLQGQHLRLGAESVLREVPSEIIRMIIAEMPPIKFELFSRIRCKIEIYEQHNRPPQPYIQKECYDGGFIKRNEIVFAPTVKEASFRIDCEYPSRKCILNYRRALLKLSAQELHRLDRLTLFAHDEFFGLKITYKDKECEMREIRRGYANCTKGITLLYNNQP